MRLPRVQFSVRKMTIAVAFIAITMGTVKLATELQYATLQNGWNTSVFATGRRVKIDRELSNKGVTLAAGTRGIVRGDPPDDDSAYPDRLISVKITEGRHQGATLMIERQFLRAE